MRTTAYSLALALICHLGIWLKALSVDVPEPVAYFPLNGENQTREIYSRSGEGDALEVSLAPGPDGAPNGSYEFFGFYSKIAFPNSAGGTLDVRYSVTLLCWALRRGHHGHLLSYANFDEDAAFFKVSLEFQGDSLIGYVEERDDPSTNISVSTPFTSRGVWVHVGMSYNNVTGELNLFCDGRLAATHNSPVGGIALPLGTQYDLCSGGYSGQITQARVYDVALTEEQVQMVYCGYSDIYTNPSANINCGNRGSGINIIIHGIPDVLQWNGSEASWRLNHSNNSACQPLFGVCNVSYGPLDGDQCATLVSTLTDFSYSFQINATVDGGSAPNQVLNHSYSFTCKYGKDGTPAVDVPEPFAYYPLNGEYETREILERTLPGDTYEVTLAPGPDGNVNGSYELFGYFSKIAFGGCGCDVLNAVRYSITMLCWVFIKQDDHHGHFLSYAHYDYGFTVSLEFYDDHLEAYIDDNGLVIVLATPFTSKGRWGHVGMSYNNFTGEINLFIDGRLAATHSNPVEGIVLDTEFELCSVEYHGRITQARLYDVALTEEQVQMVYCGYSDIYNSPSVNVECGENIGDNITIIIHGIPDVLQWNGSEASWRLNHVNNSACQPVFGVCNVSYGPLDGGQCATPVSTSTDVTYTFHVNPTVTPGSPTLAYDHSYVITCKYDSVRASFIPRHVEYDGSTTGANDLDFVMEVYSDNVHENLITSTDVPLDSVLYVRVTLNHAFQLDPLLNRCDISDGNGRRFTLIENSCETGSHLNVNYNCSRQIGVTEDFDLKAHRFPGQSGDDRVWIICDVYACLAGNTSSLCKTRCASGCSGRKRRGLGRSTDVRKYRLSSGPYRFVGRGDGQIDTTEDENLDQPMLSGSVFIALWVSGVVAVAIICGIVLLILRKRYNARRIF